MSIKKALLVPEAALSYDQIGPFVRVVNEKNIVERRGVKLGNQDGFQPGNPGRFARG